MFRAHGGAAPLTISYRNEHHVQGPELHTWPPAPCHLNGYVKLAPTQKYKQEREMCGPLESSWFRPDCPGAQRSTELLASWGLSDSGKQSALLPQGHLWAESPTPMKDSEPLPVQSVRPPVSPFVTVIKGACSAGSRPASVFPNPEPSCP